jgi:hypothetical protein
VILGHARSIYNLSIELLYNCTYEDNAAGRRIYCAIKGEPSHMS